MGLPDEEEIVGYLGELEVSPDALEENPELGSLVGEFHSAQADFPKFPGGYAVLLPYPAARLLCVDGQ